MADSDLIQTLREVVSEDMEMLTDLQFLVQVARIMSGGEIAGLNSTVKILAVLLSQDEALTVCDLITKKLTEGHPLFREHVTNPKVRAGILIDERGIYAQHAALCIDGLTRALRLRVVQTNDQRNLETEQLLLEDLQH